MSEFRADKRVLSLSKDRKCLWITPKLPVNGSIIEFMPWVYILRCADDTYYVGSARDLESRINQHAIGKAEAYTKRRRPLTLAWAQECENIGEAFELERKIKGWRRDKRLALIEGRYTDLPGLSKSRPRVTRPEPVEGQDVGPSTSSGHGYA